MLKTRKLVLVDLDHDNIGAMWARAQFHRVPRSGLGRAVILIGRLITAPLTLLSLLMMLFVQLASAPLVLITKFWTPLWGKRSYLESQRAASLKLVALGKYNPVSALSGLIMRLVYGLAPDEREPLLYLRAFGMDDRVDIDMFDGELGAPLHLEAYLVERLSDLGPFVAIGRQPKRKSGLVAQRISTTDEAWQEAVLDRMQSSRLIFVVPERTQGAQWEVEQIVASEHLLRKTVFLNTHGAGRLHSAIGDARKDYNLGIDTEFRTVCARLLDPDDADAIPHDSAQCAFVLGESMYVICTQTYTNTHGWAKSAKFAAYLMHHQVTPEELEYVASLGEFVPAWKPSPIARLRS